MNVKEDMLKKKKEINEKTEIFIFVFLAFILLTTWAMTQPFNSGPDEQMRYYFHQCDFVILPYKSASQSGVVLDADKFGRPQIAFAKCI